MEYPRPLARDWTRQYGSWPGGDEGLVSLQILVPVSGGTEGSFGGREGWRCAVWSRPFGCASSPLDGQLRQLRQLRAHAVLPRISSNSPDFFLSLRFSLTFNSCVKSELPTIRTVNCHQSPMRGLASIQDYD